MNMQPSAEAVIIGGGVIGTSILYHLTQLGMTNAVLLERDILCSGSSGKSAALVRQHYSNEVTIRIAQKSVELFTHFDDLVGGSAGFHQTGWLQLTPSQDKQATEVIVTLQQRLGINAKLLAADDVHNLFPALNTEAVAVAAYEPDGGFADPHSLATSFVNRAKERGAHVYMGTPVRDILVEGHRIRGVVTNRGTIEAPIVIIAAGPWAQRLGQTVGVTFPLQVLRSQIAIFKPQQIDDNPPMVVVDHLHGTYFRPEVGNITLVGGTESQSTERRLVSNPDSYNEKADPDYISGTSAKLCHRLPLFEQAGFVRGWAGMVTVTPDWHPILGPIADLDGAYCAVGFSGHGFKLSPAVGLLMAELITQGKASTIDISSFRLSRFETGDLFTGKYGAGSKA
jgi:sarcosine oxidase subunit beta